MKIQQRVWLTQLPALLAVAALLVGGSATLGQLAGQGRAVLGENYRSVVAAQRMNESIERLDSAALFCLAGECARGEALVDSNRSRFEAELRVEEGNLTEPGEEIAAGRLRDAWTAYAAAYERLLAASPDEARGIYFDELLPRFGEVKAACDAVLALNQDAMVAKAERSEVLAQVTRARWTAGAGVAFALALLLGGALSRRLVGPLRQFAEAATAVGDGQLGGRLPGSPVRELDDLARAFNQMSERLRLYRRAADSELTRTREAAQAAIESLVDPVLVLTVRGEVRATNEAARRQLGLSPRAKRLDGGDPALIEAADAARQAVVRDGRAVVPRDFSGAVRTGAEGEERAYLVHAAPIQDGVTGELVGVTVLLQEVTRLQHLDALKNDLVRTVAHELRTPLTSLGMALHLALDERVSGPASPALLDLLGAARDDVRRMRALVDDLLDLSRLQGGAGEAREEVDAASLLADVAAAVRPAAGVAGVSLDVDTTDAPPFSADRARVRVALVNLASNAIRHSPRGATVSLRATKGDAAVRFEVDDQGGGVALEDRERIFEPFVRADDAPGDGAGLGLSITREVVRAHAGRLGVEAAPGGGARFWVELPAPG